MRLKNLMKCFMWSVLSYTIGNIFLLVMLFWSFNGLLHWLFSSFFGVGILGYFLDIAKYSLRSKYLSVFFSLLIVVILLVIFSFGLFVFIQIPLLLELGYVIRLDLIITNTSMILFLQFLIYICTKKAPFTYRAEYTFIEKGLFLRAEVNKISGKQNIIICQKDLKTNKIIQEKHINFVYSVWIDSTTTYYEELFQKALKKIDLQPKEKFMELCFWISSIAEAGLDVFKIQYELDTQENLVYPALSQLMQFFHNTHSKVISKYLTEIKRECIHKKKRYEPRIFTNLFPLILPLLGGFNKRFELKDLTFFKNTIDSLVKLNFLDIIVEKCPYFLFQVNKFYENFIYDYLEHIKELMKAGNVIKSTKLFTIILNNIIFKKGSDTPTEQIFEKQDTKNLRREYVLTKNIYVHKEYKKILNKLFEIDPPLEVFMTEETVKFLILLGAERNSIFENKPNFKFYLIEKEIKKRSLKFKYRNVWKIYSYYTGRALAYLKRPIFP